nr:MAG TPA: hypothetical protein [Caudoviricetes sp.]
MPLGTLLWIQITVHDHSENAPGFSVYRYLYPIFVPL